MLLWIALSWLALSIATAAAFHVARSRLRPVPVPPEVRTFLRQLDEIIRAQHPEVNIRGMLPGRFAVVLEVQGQEVPVPLHQLFRHASTFPEAMPQMVDTLLREIGSGGLTRISEHRFEDVATRILPQVRSAQWVSAHSPAFGDAALITRPLADDLRVCYVVDDPWSMVFVCRAHLRQWGIDDEAVHTLATQNLQRLGARALPVPGTGDAPVVVHTGDGYDAARVLLLDPEQAEGLLVAMPERDTLWLGTSASGERDAMSALMALNREQNAASAYPVSPTLYRVQGGQLEAVRE
jgi:uncharacterized protein YtpQ (UPF0354 family)